MRTNLHFLVLSAILGLMALALNGCDSSSSDSEETSDSSSSSSTLSQSSDVTLYGSVYDANVVYADVNLMLVGSAIPVATTTTALDGTYSFANVDLSSLSDTDALYLIVSGKEAVSGSPSCAGAPTTDTFVDVDDSGTFVGGTDKCIGATLTLKSYIGSKTLLGYLGGEGDVTLGEEGAVDEAGAPSLRVSHITTAQVAVIEGYMSDSGTDVTLADADPAEVDYMNTTVTELLETDDALKLQIATVATIIKAVTHEEVLSTDLQAALTVIGDVTELATALIQGTETLTAADETFVDAQFSADTTDYISSSLSIEETTVLAGSTGSGTNVPELEAAVDNFATITDILAAFKTDMDSHVAKLVYPPNRDRGATVLSHPDYLRDGRDRTQRWDYLEGIYTDDIVRDAAVVSVSVNRYQDASGADLFWDASAKTFTINPNSNYVYRYTGEYLLKFDDDTFSHKRFKGFLVTDGTAGALQYSLGNRKRFDVRASARNLRGQKAIRLHVLDPENDPYGGQFEITQVFVEVTGDTALDALTTDDLAWKRWTTDTSTTNNFKLTCDLGDLDDQTLTCLRDFYLGLRADSGDGYAFWANRFSPGSTTRTWTYRIPPVWTPQAGSDYQFTVDYLDLGNGGAGGQAIINKTMGIYPGDDTLAKLVDASGSLVSNEVVGTDASLTFNWTYKPTDSAIEPVFPSKTTQWVGVWDNNGGAYVTGRRISGSARTATFTGDFSSYTNLRFNVVLTLPDGGDGVAQYWMFKNGSNWEVTPFYQPRLRHIYRSRFDWRSGSLVETLIDHGNLRVSTNGDVFGTNLTFTDNADINAIYWDSNLGDVPAGATLRFSVRDIRWEQYDPAGDYRFDLDSANLASNASLTINYTSDYDSDSGATAEIPLAFRSTANDQPRNVVVSVTTDGKIQVDWTAPVNGANLYYSLPYGATIYHGNVRLLNFFTTAGTTATTPAALISPADSDDIRINLTAVYNSHFNYGEIDLRCRYDQVVAGTCIGN